MNTIEKYEVALYEDLKQYLLEQGEVDEHMPECPDVEDKWQAIGEA